MSRTEVGLGLLLALCACKDKLSWNAHVITQITEGPFKFQIPPPWRDLTESSDPGLARLPRRADASAHLIVRENDTNTDTNIAFMWTFASKGASCETVMLELDHQSNGGVDRAGAKQESMAGDPTCTFRFGEDDVAGVEWLRFHGDHMLTIQCMHLKKGDANADQWCDHFAAELRAQTAP